MCLCGIFVNIHIIVVPWTFISAYYFIPLTYVFILWQSHAVFIIIIARRYDLKVSMLAFFSVPLFNIALLILELLCFHINFGLFSHQ